MTYRFKNRLAQFFAFSLITDFLSLKILRQILSKTLNFLKMDSYFFSADSSAAAAADDDDSLYGSTTARSIQSLSDLDDENLYLVDHRWWNEPREAMLMEVDGVSYAASCCLSADFDSEIVMEMRRTESNREEQGGSGRAEYALVSEWMFYRALKWFAKFVDWIHLGFMFYAKVFVTCTWLD